MGRGDGREEVREGRVVLPVRVREKGEEVGGEIRCGKVHGGESGEGFGEVME